MKPLAYMLIFAMAPNVTIGTCGEKGGPGYRGPSGRCVSWQQIGKVCGTPPEARCTPEIAHKDGGGGVQREGRRYKALCNQLMRDAE